MYTERWPFWLFSPRPGCTDQSMSAYDEAMLDGCIADTQSSVAVEYCDQWVVGEHAAWCALIRNLPFGAFGLLVSLAAAGWVNAFIHIGTSGHLE